MIGKKSFYLYHPMFNKIHLTKDKNLYTNTNTFYSSTGNIFHSNSTSYANSINFPLIIKSHNNFDIFNSKMKRTKSTINLIDYKFYKILKREPLTPTHKPKINYQDSIGASPFYLGSQSKEDELLEKIMKINTGNKKHEMLAYIASKKEKDKKRNVKKFMKEMKLAKINMKLINQRNIEEQKIKNELNNLKYNKLRKTRNRPKIKYKNFNSANTLNKKNSVSNISINNIIDNERKLAMKKGKLMHRFYEIMNNLKSKK